MSRDHYFFRIKMVVGNDEDPSDFKLSGSFKFENFFSQNDCINQGEEYRMERAGLTTKEMDKKHKKRRKPL